MSAEAASTAVDLLLSGEYDGSQQVAQELRKRGLTRGVLHRTTVAKLAKAKAEQDGHCSVAKRGQPVREFTAKQKGATPCLLSRQQNEKLGKRDVHRPKQIHVQVPWNVSEACVMGSQG